MAAESAAKTNFMVISPDAALFPGRLSRSLSLWLHHRTLRRSGARLALSLGGVLDIGFRPVVAGGGFGLPLAVRGLVFDHLGAARHPLLGRRPPCRRQRRAVAPEWLGKSPIDGVSPAAVMLDDLVGHVVHRELAVAYCREG